MPVASTAVRRSFPKLPGTPKPRPIVDVDATHPTSIDAAAQLRRDLLAALQYGPRMKWELREQLHVPETIIVRQLRRLRIEGHVKVVGKVLDKRGWALKDWQRPTPTERYGPLSLSRTGEAPKKSKAPTESWWAKPGITREDFNQALQRRDQECGRILRSEHK
jgi:hypothetical protein